MTDINKVLEERGQNYGDFEQHAYITQSLKEVAQERVDWKDLCPYMQESLDMIFHKIGRILNGNPYYLDSWVDIVGYAQLVVNELERMEKEKDST